MAQVLHDAGLIQRHVVGVGQMIEVFFKSELDQFLAGLYRKAVLVDAPAENMCGVTTAAKRTNASTSEIVRLIHDDRLAWVGRKHGVPGVLGLLVDVEEVGPLVRLPGLEGVVPSEAEEVLRVNSKVIRCLLAKGILGTVLQRHPIKRNLTTVIPHTEIARFSETYVSLFILAREQGKHMPILKRELAALGVLPAPELADVGATFYRRSELKSP